jgi:hypothetical protein
MEHSLGLLHLVLPEAGKRIIFTEVVMLGQAVVAGKFKDDINAFISNKIPGEKTGADLIRQAAYVGPDTVKSVFLERPPS